MNNVTVQPYVELQCSALRGVMVICLRLEQYKIGKGVRTNKATVDKHVLFILLIKLENNNIFIYSYFSGLIRFALSVNIKQGSKKGAENG